MNKNILVVDDDTQIVELLRVNLENIGYRVEFALDGEKALIKARQNPPDLIILDLMLPGIDGHEVCQILRTEKPTRFTPILILSAKEKPADKITCLRLGANDYITKPFDINELIARVDSFLKHVEEVVSINPLTKLPGNVSIMNEVNKRLINGKKFAFIYLDINDFKSYNDKYGYNKGDEIIKLTGDIIIQNAKESDFVGHIGGDDFILICDIENMDSIQKKIRDSFDADIPRYYEPEDRQKGYIISEDRQGKTQTFPIMTLSIGIVTNERKDLNHYGKIVEVATEMKKYAKQKSANKSSFAKDKRVSDDKFKDKRKIMIAEDDLNLQTLLRINLEAKGFNVLTVDTGKIALSEYFSFNPDLVILDMMLPEVLGIDVCQQIRQSNQGTSVPIILISGVYNKLEFRINAKDAGATDIITKPFEINDFVSYVERLISEAATVQSIPGQGEKAANQLAPTKKYSADKKVLVHYPDGKIIKGITAALNPGGPGFNMTVYGENRRIYVAYAAVSRVDVVDEF